MNRYNTAYLELNGGDVKIYAEVESVYLPKIQNYIERLQETTGKIDFSKTSDGLTIQKERELEYEQLGDLRAFTIIFKENYRVLAFAGISLKNDEEIKNIMKLLTNSLSTIKKVRESFNQLRVAGVDQIEIRLRQDNKLFINVCRILGFSVLGKYSIAAKEAGVAMIKEL